MGVETEIAERPNLRNIFGSSAHRFIACSTHCISVNHRPAQPTLLDKLWPNNRLHLLICIYHLPITYLHTH